MFVFYNYHIHELLLSLIFKLSIVPVIVLIRQAQALLYPERIWGKAALVQLVIAHAQSTLSIAIHIAPFSGNLATTSRYHIFLLRGARADVSQNALIRAKRQRVVGHFQRA